jgi:Ca2+-transporting ATPase
MTGNPTEQAFLEAGEAAGLDQEKLNRRYPRLEESPFDSTRKYMMTKHRMEKGPFGMQGLWWICKGAPDVLLPRCQTVWQQHGWKTMTEELRNQIRRQNEQLAREGLRVLAFALSTDTKKEAETVGWLGYIALMDPPRPEVRGAIQSCKSAGIRIVMITGDHPTTAKTIAANLGIGEASATDNVLTGAQLDQMDDEQLKRRLPQISVFARVTPTHKLRIVQCLKACHETVAMTGDGVNDSPALKAADIGCAMGKNGTDVARNASDMILTDDNFATIVAAVKEGRTIYDNIRKSIHFLLSSNIGEILTIFTAIVMGYPSPLLPVQLLWMNLVTDSLPAISLGVEPSEEDIMRRAPIPRDQSIFAGGFGLRIFLEGIMIGLLALIAYLVGYRMEGAVMAQTMTFMVLCLSQLFHVFNVRSRRSLFHIGFLSNKKLVFSFLICFALQISVAILPVLQSLFSVASMNTVQWGVVMGLSISPILIIEMEKWLNESSDDAMD